MSPEGLLSVSELAPSSGRDDALRRFTEAASPLYAPVYQFVARQIASHADAADVAQQAFIQAFRSFHRYDPQRPFAPWIYRIARRAIADHYRRGGGRALVSLDESLPDTSLNPHQEACRGEEQSRLWKLASGLPSKFYQVLLLHYAEGFSVSDVAVAMGLTTTHVKVLLFRARAALRRRIEAEADDPRIQSP